MQNFELASRSVSNRSYEARRKPWPLIESLRYLHSAGHTQGQQRSERRCTKLIQYLTNISYTSKDQKSSITC